MQIGQLLEALDGDKVPYSIEKTDFDSGTDNEVEKFVSLRIQALLNGIIDQCEEFGVLQILIGLPQNNCQLMEKLVSKAIWSDNMQKQLHSSYTFKYVDFAILSIKAIQNELKERTSDAIYNQIRALPNLENPELANEVYFQNEEEFDAVDEDEISKKKMEAKDEFQKLIIRFLMEDSEQFSNQLLKKILLQTPKLILPNMTNPLFLSDFLTSCLNHER